VMYCTKGKGQILL